MSNPLTPVPRDKIGETHGWRDWFTNIYNILGKAFFTGNTSTTATTGSVTPPTKVAGYLEVNINNVTYKVPYYNG
jgi:hypothetical protein